MKIVLGDIYTIGLATEGLKPNVSYRVKIRITNDSDDVVRVENQVFTPIVPKRPIKLPNHS